MARILTFLSDFGLADPYVAAVKGVLLTHCPELNIIDVSHSVAAHDVLDGAMLLRDAFGTFPPGTFHLAVVDPGVGGERPALLVRTDRFTFVGPDNGLMAPSLEGEDGASVFHIRPDWDVPSATFHARDVFAPAAGRLLAGDKGDSFLVPAAAYRRLELPRPAQLPAAAAEFERWQGHVLRIDHFGNLITNLSRAHFGPLFERYAFELWVPGGSAVSRLAPTYAEAPAAAPVVIWGSSGMLEISIREYSAARVLGIGRAGATFDIAFSKGGQP